MVSRWPISKSIQQSRSHRRKTDRRQARARPSQPGTPRIPLPSLLSLRKHSSSLSPAPIQTVKKLPILTKSSRIQLAHSSSSLIWAPTSSASTPSEMVFPPLRSRL